MHSIVDMANVFSLAINKIKYMYNKKISLGTKRNKRKKNWSLSYGEW